MECFWLVGIYYYYKSCKSLGKYIWLLGIWFCDVVVGEKYIFIMVIFVFFFFYISIFFSG